MRTIKFTERRAIIKSAEGEEVQTEVWSVNRPIQNEDNPKNLHFFAHAGITYYLVS
jgi:hypothetical protein